MTRVVLHVDRLVLRGLARSDAASITQSLQQELQRILCEPGRLEGLAGSGERQGLSVGRVRIRQGTGAAGTGHAIAQSIAGRARS